MIMILQHLRLGVTQAGSSNFNLKLKFRVNLKFQTQCQCGSAPLPVRARQVYHCTGTVSSVWNLKPETPQTWTRPHCIVDSETMAFLFQVAAARRYSVASKSCCQSRCQWPLYQALRVRLGVALFLFLQFTGNGKFTLGRLGAQRRGGRVTVSLSPFASCWRLRFTAQSCPSRLGAPASG